MHYALVHYQLCYENGCHACVCFLVKITRLDWLVTVVYMSSCVHEYMPVSTKIIDWQKFDSA